MGAGGLPGRGTVQQAGELAPGAARALAGIPRRGLGGLRPRVSTSRLLVAARRVGRAGPDVLAEADVGHRQLSRARDLGDEGAVGASGGAVDEHADPFTSHVQERDEPARPGFPRPGPSAGTCTLRPASSTYPRLRLDPETDRKSGVAEGAGKPSTQRARLTEVNDQAGDSGPGPATPAQIGAEPGRHRRDEQVVKRARQLGRRAPRPAAAPHPPTGQRRARPRRPAQQPAALRSGPEATA